MNNIIAGIVTYNPDYECLLRTISGVSGQVEQIVIVDNSEEKNDYLVEIANKGVKVIYNECNKGIAFALNQIMEYADSIGIGWVITMDQDSYCPCEYVNVAFNRVICQKNMNVGQIVPLLYECNTGVYCYMREYPNGQDNQVVSRSITSAAITSVEAWHIAGGYDEDLFIDYVDFDFSIKLRNKGYQIVRLNDCILKHQMGRSELKRFLLWKLRVTNYPTFRKYYIVRNLIIFCRRYGGDIKVYEEVLSLFRFIFITVIYESNKINNLKAIFKGIVDGFKYKKI